MLFGDDGFGPAVAEQIIRRGGFSDDVAVLDAGTGVREILFDIVLSETRPEKIIVVDGLSVAGRSPGEVFMISIDDLPENKRDDFSLHQMPTSNLLKELNSMCGVKVVVVAAQVEGIPPEVAPGLSGMLAGAVPRACGMVMGELAESESSVRADAGGAGHA